MAAVIELRTGTALEGARPSAGARPALAPHIGARPAPALRLVHGGRSARARQLRRTFWLRRAAVLVLALVVCWVGVQAVRHALMPIDAGAPVAQQLGSVHTVQRGDTLWSLATAVDPQADPRDVVDRIVELNAGGPALGADGQLLAGEQLRLPVAS